MKRLSDFENEKALDLVANIIEPMGEIMTDEKIVNIFRSGKPAILAISGILKDHKKAATEIIAALHETTPEELRFNVVSLTKDIMTLVNDPGIREVFTMQGQTPTADVSGSAMVNTGETEGI